MSSFPLSRLLRASALMLTGPAASPDAPADTWLPNGYHLRVRLASRLGFPLHPFAAYRFPREGIPTRLALSDERGYPWSLPAVLSATGPLYCWPSAASAARYCYLKVQDDGTNRIRAELLHTALNQNGTPRVLARRRSAPYAFGGSDIGWLRLSGDGTVTGAFAVDADSLQLEEPPVGPPTTFGLPIPSGPWFVAGVGDPVGTALKRVGAGAPKLFGPPDRPGANFGPAGEGDEIDRISALQPMIGRYLDQAFAGPSMPGTKLRPKITTAGVENRVEFDPVQALLMMAADPGIARYLGLATVIGQTNQEDLPELCLIAALWLLPLDRRPTPDTQPFPNQTLRELLAGCQTPAWVLDALYQQFPDLKTQAATMLTKARAATPGDGWELVPLLTVACAAGLAPPDLPDPPGLSAPGQLPALRGEAPSPGRRWQVSSAGKQWAQTLLLPDGEPLGPVGFARTAPGTPTSLHRLGPAGPSGTARAITLLPSWSPQFQAATVSDLGIPADPGGAAWRLWQADEWGRWGGASHTSAPPPDPTPPPAPSLEILFQPIPPADAAGRTSPGNLAIRIGIPHQGSDPISKDPSAPGGAPVTMARLTIDGGAPLTVNVPAGADSVTHREPLGPMDVAMQRTVTCTATLIDGDGLSSAATSGDCLVSDGRAHLPAKTAPTLLFASAEDATGQSEIGLRWPAAAWGYRVYIADESRLAGALSLPASNDLRCQRAANIWQGSSRLTDKSQFTLITSTPIMGDPDGQVRLRHRVPGTLSNVQFIRIVPVTAAGIETPFGQCGLVPVTVPYVDRPLPPRLSVKPRTDGKAGVAIEVSGAPADRLQALVPAGHTAALTARLRRTRSSNLEPIYLPITNTSIPLNENGQVFAGTTADGPPAGLTPFVRYTWIAEARYPAEPAQPPGTVPPAGGDLVQPLYGTLGDASEGAWSDSSQPASTLITNPPPAAPAATAIVHAGVTTITIAAAPVAAQDAIGPYRAQVLRHGSNGYQLIADQPIQATPFALTDYTPSDSYAVIVIDALGISSQPTTLSPTEPVTVPNLIGLSAAAAKNAAADFRLNEVRGEGRTGWEGAAGVVYQQNPSAGTLALKGSVLTVTEYDDAN